MSSFGHRVQPVVNSRKNSLILDAILGFACGVIGFGIGLLLG